MEPVPLRYLAPPNNVEDWSDVFGVPRGPRELREAPWEPSMEAEGKMVLYAGWSRQTERIVDVIDRGAGAGEIVCAECQGTGAAHGANGRIVCPRCGGNGWELVSIP